MRQKKKKRFNTKTEVGSVSRMNSKHIMPPHIPSADKNVTKGFNSDDNTNSGKQKVYFMTKQFKWLMDEE